MHRRYSVLILVQPRRRVSAKLRGPGEESKQGSNVSQLWALLQLPLTVIPGACLRIGGTFQRSSRGFVWWDDAEAASILRTNQDVLYSSPLIASFKSVTCDTAVQAIGH